MLRKLNPYLIFIIVFIIEVVFVSIFLEELVAGLFGGMMMIIVVLFFHFFIASIFFYLEKLKTAYCVLLNILIVPVFFLLIFFRINHPGCILEELTAEEVAERSCKRYLNNNVPAVSINHVQINELTDSMKAEVTKKIEEGIDLKQATMEVNIYYSVDTEELILCKCLTDENGELVWPR